MVQNVILFATASLLNRSAQLILGKEKWLEERENAQKIVALKHPILVNFVKNIMKKNWQRNRVAKLH